MVQIFQANLKLREAISGNEVLIRLGFFGFAFL